MGWNHQLEMNDLSQRRLLEMFEGNAIFAQSMKSCTELEQWKKTPENVWVIFLGGIVLPYIYPIFIG